MRGSGTSLLASLRISDVTLVSENCSLQNDRILEFKAYLIHHLRDRCGAWDVVVKKSAGSRGCPVPKQARQAGPSGPRHESHEWPVVGSQ